MSLLMGTIDGLQTALAHVDEHGFGNSVDDDTIVLDAARIIAASDIHELFDLVRQHPDFVFGTIFVKDDIPDDAVEDIESFERVGTDLLVEHGNTFIQDQLG